MEWNIAGWNGTSWNGMEYRGMEWNILGWNGTSRDGIEPTKTDPVPTDTPRQGSTAGVVVKVPSTRIPELYRGFCL